jgi:hypothetical protein
MTFIDDTHERLMREVLAWMCSHRLFGDPREHERTYAQEALVAATFGYLCSAAHVGEAQWRLAAKFTAIFLYLDDTRDPDDAHPAIAEWLHELERIGAGRSALADFRVSFADYQASLVEERRLSLSALAREDYLALRRRTIFVEPYLDHWRVLAGIDVDPELPARELLCAGQGLARELIILANDLGSLVRDTTAEQTEMNLVVRDARQLGSLDAAIDQAVAEYNAIAVQLRELVRQANASLPALAQLLARVVDGNNETMKLLGRRYTQSTALLERLLPIA